MDIGFSSHNITLHAVTDIGRILNKGLVGEALKPGSGYILIFERKVDQDVIGCCRYIDLGQVKDRRQYALVESCPVKTYWDVDGCKLLHHQTTHRCITCYWRVFTESVLMPNADKFSPPRFTGPRRHRLVITYNEVVGVEVKACCILNKRGR